MQWVTSGLASLLAALLLPAAAAPLPADELQRSCWLRHTSERTQAQFKELTRVDFSNLGNGYKVRAPFLVEFGVRGMGVVPAGKALQGTGHHHILIDAPLPLQVNAQLPFSDTHKHFGKGQTMAVLDLPPGKHTLRLLFADHEHRPYFVYSPEITVEVLAKRTADPVKIDPRNFDATCEAWYQDEVARPRPPGEWVGIANLRSGEPVTSPFNVRFTVDGFGVCAAGQSAERTGHFMLEILQEGRLVRLMDYSNGATQGNLGLANGTYTLRLRFVDGKTRADLLPASETTVTVSGQERL
jgi:hypothetical protein